jgi:hypothetical protein
MADINPSSHPAVAARFSWAAAIVALVLLAGFFAGRAFPFFASALELKITFPEGIADRNEPLLATGVFRAGDFLTVRYIDAKTAVLAYDAWGAGGPSSEPFALNPGSARTLRIEMPALGPKGEIARRGKRPLRVVLDGREVLHGDVSFHARKPAEIFFGNNPIGGNTAGGHFRGVLATPDGRVLQGGAESYFSWRTRAGCWFTEHPGQIAGVLLASVLAGWLARPIRRWFAAHRPSALPARLLFPHPIAPHRWAIGMMLACAVGFTWLISFGTFQIPYQESFGTFYDEQAKSILHGHLDVPEPSLSGEAFVVNGKVYGYFGPTPAILRMPFVLAGVGFGKLIRGFMLADYLACLAAAYALLCFAVRLLTGTGGWPSRVAVVVFIASIGFGSTLFFLGSRAYIYHEAILCGAAFALWSAYFSLRHLEAPQRRWWIASLVCGIAAMHARPPAGLFSLAILGGVAAVQLIAAWRRRQSWRTPLLIGALAAVGVTSFSGMSYLKFGTFDGSPFRYSVQYTPERRAKFGDKNFHVSNIGHNVDTYLFSSLHFDRRFPWIYFGETLRFHPDAKIDLEEAAGSLPLTAPAIFWLALLGGAWAAFWVPRFRLPLAILAFGVTPMALALFMAIVTSHRYTGDFCAFLIATAAFGLAALDAERPRLRRTVLTATALLGLAGGVVTFALALQFQRHDIWGVPEQVQRNYEQFRQKVDAWFGVLPPKGH